MNGHIGTRINDLLVSTNEGKHTERKSGFTHIVNVTCSCKYHICSKTNMLFASYLVMMQTL